MEDYKKKYEEAVKKFKNFFDDGDDRILYKHDIETIFPELKESEDEKIRKELIKLMKQMSNTIVENYTTIEISTFVAWLEKQGEQKQNITNLISDLENYFATTTKEQQEKDWEEIKNWEEKHFNHNNHIEQKPTNKVEPKFHDGEWITIKK